MKGVKAFDKGLVCRGYKFEENRTFEEKGKPRLCSKGFHFCENPLDTLNYYNLTECEFAEVEALGDVVKDDNKDTKAATNKIKIGAKLNLPAFIKLSFDFLWEKCGKEKNNEKIIADSGDNSKVATSGNYSQVATSGDDSQVATSGDDSKVATSGYNSQVATSGDDSQVATSGYYSQVATSGDDSQVATSGDNSQVATSGDNSKVATSGYYSQVATSGYNSKVDLKGEYSVGACVGHNSKIRGKKGNWITLAEWKWDNKKEVYIPICVKSAQIDGKKLKEDTWYKLENKKFVEVKEEK